MIILEVENKLLLNGATYTGNIENNMPHGYGVYETKNIKYTGYFTNGVFDLFGTLIDKVIKYTYTGEFKNGMKNGYGRLVFNDGKYFEGLFTNNMCNDFGYMEYPDKEKYIGEFKNNKADGSGSVYYANGNIFTGEFKDDKEAGIGVIMEKDNNSYGIKVEYTNGYTLIHGQIKLTSELNTHMVYRMIDNSDYRYYGMIDKYSNFIKGICHYKNHESFLTFVGNFTDEFRNGVLFFKNNDIFKGFFENNELTGKGEYIILGKGTYIGEFIDGKKNGDFVFVDYNGNKYHHKYDMDKLIQVREEVQ